jgi:hypothetical protein
MLIYLQDAGLAMWTVDASFAGVLRTTPGGAGPAQPVRLRAPNGTCWQLTVDVVGILGRDPITASTSYPTSMEFYSASNQRWVLTVANGGVFGILYPPQGPALKALPIALVDVLTADGTLYYWGDVAGQYPVRVGAGPNATYKAKVQSAGPMRRSRDTRTDAGDIVIENLSGNTIERESAAALRDHEFAGAMAVLRIMDPLTEEVLREYHGYFGQPLIEETKVTFRLRQLADPNRVDVPAYDYMAQCGWKYKSKRCGSVSAEPKCPKSYVACGVRAVQHHYPGISMVPQTSLVQIS